MVDHHPSITILIPAYNEEQTLEKAVSIIRETLLALRIESEIVIVNDCSIDTTGAIADSLTENEPSITVIHHSANQGIGGAFRTGTGHATKDFIILMPVDNPLTKEELEIYLPRMSICDIVVGVRVERVGSHPVAHAASFIYNRILVPILFNIGVSDVNWIQAYRREIFVGGGISIEYTGIFFLVELLVKARHKKLIIAEVPSQMRRRMYGIPTSARYGTMWRTFWDMIDFFVKIHSRRRTRS